MKLSLQFFIVKEGIMLQITLQIVKRILCQNIQVLKRRSQNEVIYISRHLLILVIALFICSGSIAQQSQVKFNILKKDKSIGILQIEKKENTPYTDYRVSSSIEVSFIKKFRVNATEKFRYKDGLLIFSSVNRSINEKKKDPKKLLFLKGKYVITDGETRRTFQYPEITSNLVLLYFFEPIHIKTVYCDNLQIMVELKKIAANQYRIDFPNGVSNVFYYKAGKCVRVDVTGTFFKARLLKV